MERGTTIGNQRIASLFDSGTFVEIGSFMRRSDEELTAAVCGYGAIDGKLAYAFAQDSDRKKGAFDALQAKKIEMLYKMALKNGAPVIGVFDSVGAVVSDGANALAAYGTLLKAVSEASGVIPQIAVIAGPGILFFMQETLVSTNTAPSCTRFFCQPFAFFTSYICCMVLRTKK